MRFGARLFFAFVAACFGATASAGPVTYDYRFAASSGDLVALGTFTTGAASVEDPGYFLLTAMTLTQVRDGAGNLLTGFVSTTAFQPGAAYDPTTSAFVNHAFGDTYPDVGLTRLLGSIGPDQGLGISGGSFSMSSSLFSASFRGPSSAAFYTPTTLEIAAVSAAIPEPATSALLAAGLLVGLPLLRRRGSRPVAATITTPGGVARRGRQPMPAS